MITIALDDQRSKDIRASEGKDYQDCSEEDSRPGGHGSHTNRAANCSFKHEAQGIEQTQSHHVDAQNSPPSCFGSSKLHHGIQAGEHANVGRPDGPDRNRSKRQCWA